VEILSINTRSVIAVLLCALLTAGCGGIGDVGGSPSGGATPAPAVDFNANPASIAHGVPTSLAWNSSDATTCTAFGGWAGNKPTSGIESTAALTASTSFGLTCSGSGGSTTKTVAVAVAPPVTTVTLTANPAAVTSGGSATLNWSATNATSCVASGGWSGAKATTGSETSAPLTATTGFTLTCTGPDGSVSQTVTVTVNPPAPTVSLSANPATVIAGNASSLTWGSTDASSCVASGAWSGAKAPGGGTESTGSLSATSTYTLTCTGAGGSTSQSVTVTAGVPPPPPTVTLATNPAIVATGGSSALTWNSTNTTSCTASGGWSGIRATSGTESTAPLSATTSYTLACTGPGGNANQSVTVTVAPAPAPAISLSTSPTTVTSGGSSKLTWTSTNATSCSASGGWSGAKAVSGSQSTPPLTATTSFTLSCTGAGGSASQAVTVTVAPAPNVTLAASPTGVASGGASTLTWSSTNATSCTASGGWSGTRATNGTQSTGTLTTATDFTLTCTGAGGSASATASVAIDSAPTVTLSAAPTGIASGATSVLTWNSTNSTSCAASGGWTGAKAANGSETTSALTATTTFTLSCTGAVGSASRSVTVTVLPAPAVTLTANPAAIASGGSSTLTWTATDATSCSASGGWSGIRAASGTESTAPLSATTSYTLTCTGPGGSANRSVTVTVAPAPAPAITLSASPTTVTSGGSSKLTWTSTNATSCSASGGWSGSKAASGTESTAPLSAATSYTLTCTGPGGSAAQTATVTVAAPPAPAVALTANPVSVNSGGTSTLTWSSTNATTCTASSGWSGVKAASGTESTAPLSAATSYTLTCTGPGGSANQSVTVTVAPPPAPAITLSANPAAVTSGGSSTLTWTSTNATSCSASGGWNGIKAANGTESTAPLSTATSYTLTCTGPGGKSAQTATVAVNTPPVPTVSFTANPVSVNSGGTSKLTWSSTNATTCTASGGWSGIKAASGTESTAPLSATTSYTLTCTGPGGSSAQTATVAVNTPPAPTVSLTANPVSVNSGGTSTLTWSSTNATTCTASGGWSGSTPTSGSQSTGALTSTTGFSLSCSGAGGSTSQSETVTVVSGAAFPLHVEGGTRYLIDANGKPFFLQGDAAWSLMVQLTRQQVDQYLEDRRQKGFNAVLVNLVEHQFTANPPRNAYGDAPFTVPGDFSTPNAAYFNQAEYVISHAAAKGILVVLAPAYMGYGGGSEGWYQEMVANGAPRMRAYGQFVANRFKAYNNILWVDGGDFNPPEKTLLRAVANGIRDVSPAALQTFHGSRGTSALGFLGTAETWLNVNNIYTDDSTVVADALTEYARSTMPFFLIEALYENEGAGETVVRAQAYQAVLSGGTGHIMGNRPIWLFDPGWQGALNSAGARTLANLRSLFESIDWWTLVPDSANTFLTAGVGSGGSRAVASRASSGSLALVYMPTARTLTLAMGQLAGPHVRARWFDPANGAYTTVSGSPFPASGSQAFAPTGSNAHGLGDWVLVLDSVP